MSEAIVVLRLEGPLQSWGERSKWDHRDTAAFPTKSGIVGLIGCAMGVSRDDASLNAIARGIHLAVRQDCAGSLLKDFQTITGAPLLNAEGKKRSLGNTIISNKRYLQGASFAVFINGERELIEKIQKAFSDPKWPCYLGRKGCVPAVPIFQGVYTNYDSLEEALSDLETFPLSKYRSTDDKYVLYEIDSTSSYTYSRSDDYEDYPSRSFKNRYVELKRLEVT